MTEIFSGILTKLKVNHHSTEPIQYLLEQINLNKFIGQTLYFKFKGECQCIYCNRKIKKTFGDGYCFPCFRSLARCDTCIVKPELCHFHAGTCREPEWGKTNCMIKHAVYLAVTSDLKVGITREHQKFTRWMDQGALQALVLGYTNERKIAGMVEVELAKNISDRTNWRDLLTGKTNQVDLLAKRVELKTDLARLAKQYDFEIEQESNITNLIYPVDKYLSKASSINLEKVMEFSSTLIGIRGQYLIFEMGGINIRKYQGYWVDIGTPTLVG